MRFNIFSKGHMGHRQTVIIRGIIVTLLAAVISLALFFLVGIKYTDTMFETDNDIKIYNITEGTIDKSNWVSPVVDSQYGYIICDEVGLNAPLYYGDSENVLLKGAGQSVSSYFPGQGGTVLVGGHDTTFFGCLESINENMKIKVDTEYGVFEYNVTDISIVSGSDYDIKSDKEQLVLYTCYPFGKTDINRTKKIIFVCDKVSGPVIGGAGDE